MLKSRFTSEMTIKWNNGHWINLYINNIWMYSVEIKPFFFLRYWGLNSGPYTC
jgi:hypothetical protein